VNRRLEIGIRSHIQRAGSLREAVRRASSGRHKPQPAELYFESTETLRSILTEKRMGLVLAISRNRPASIQELAALVGRNYKNVSTDVTLLERLGLVRLSAGRGKGKPRKPIIPYDEICVTIDLHRSPDARAAT
jgi:predicted transcriptional regulator